MVVDEPTRGDTGTALPLLTLHSMTQSQLKELIPQLVTRVTGRSSPLFGSVGDKPDWWPCDLEWTSPEELADKYKNPCERLREIVRSCYCYMDQDNLLNSSEELSSEVPVSPAVGDTDVGASDSDTELPSFIQVELVGTDVKKEFDEKLKEPISRMTIQSETRPIEDVEKCSEKVEQAKAPAEEAAVHSGCNKIESCNNTEHSRMNDVKTNSAAVDATVNNSVQDCEITGVSLDATQDISADVIAQIDFEIAKSLSAAFKNIGALGLTNSGLMNDGNSTRNSPLSCLGVDKSLQIKPVKKRRSSAEDVRQQTSSVKSFSEISKLFLKKPKHVQQRSVNTEKTSSELGRLLKKPVSVTVKDAGIKSASVSHEKIDSTEGIKSNLTENEQLPDIVKEDSKEEKPEDDVVWICFVCAKGFANQSELMKHQDVCEEEQNNTNPVFKSSQTVSPKGHSVLPKPQPVPALLRKVGSSLKSLPLGLPNMSTVIRKRQRKFEDIYIPPSRDVYFESLGLFPTPRVEAISKSPRKSVTDEDCQIIDLTMDDPQAVPMTPRTRSMLSQLSRDDSSGRRRQLSFSQNAPPALEKEQVDLKELSEDSDSSEEEETVEKHKVPSKSAILGIPLTSPLGQRLKKHWNYENKVPVIEDIEMFCKTNASSLLHVDRNKTKNPMVEKLRNRPPPQCTFRFTKKYINRWCHSYKFNKADKKEFRKRLKFRLDRDSRIKLKKMKKCRVVLARLSQKDIKYWTNPRPKVVQKRFLPETTMLPQYNRQYRVNQIQNVMASSTANRPPQGALYSPLIQPLRFGAPIPQLLVRPVPMGVQGMRLQVLPVQQAQNQNIFLSTSNNLMPITTQEMIRSQKRKQVFNNVREDDNMVICLSSDEEEEIVIKPQPRPQQQKCAMCNIFKNNCKIHGKRRIGPASFMRQQSNNADVAASPTCKGDNVSSRPDSIVAGSTVNMVHPAQYANTASARIFGSSIRPSVQNAQFSAQPKANYTHMKISDGTATVIHNISNASGSVPVHQDASLAVQVENAAGSAENDKNENQSAESEYMDYEVICIDSDEDN